MELKFDDEVFRVYALSIGVLMAKFLMMSFLTARQRFANMVCTWIQKKFYASYRVICIHIYWNYYHNHENGNFQVFSSPEDTVGSSKAKVSFTNENVERVRRAHQNDIENIVPFAILSFLYLVVANPTLFTAKCVFYGFTVARVLHSFVYLNQVRTTNFMKFNPKNT